VYQRRLVAAVDSLPQTKGMGVLLVDHGRKQILRPSGHEKPFVVIQLRDVPNKQPAKTPIKVSLKDEWISLGLNLTGATVAWIGVAGSVAAAPETVGGSLIVTGLMWAGAVSSTVQVLNSAGRIIAVYAGKARTVDWLDNQSWYSIANTSLDIIGLAGAATTAVQTVKMVRKMRTANVTVREGLGQLSRPQRRRLTEALELAGNKRATAAAINLTLKFKLLDALGAAYGTGVSTYNGALHQLVVWIVYPTAHSSSWAIFQLTCAETDRLISLYLRASARV
jgi:hypothetical protein